MAYAPLWTVTLGGERPQEIVGELVSCNYFDVLRQRPAIGPGFTALNCETRGAPPVAKDSIVRWPNQPPTNGIAAHEQEAIAFFKMFPDQHLINNPYKIVPAQNDWTCTVADIPDDERGNDNARRYGC